MYLVWFCSKPTLSRAVLAEIFNTSEGQKCFYQRIKLQLSSLWDSGGKIIKYSAKNTFLVPGGLNHDTVAMELFYLFEQLFSLAKPAGLLSLWWQYPDQGCQKGRKECQTCQSPCLAMTQLGGVSILFHTGITHFEEVYWWRILSVERLKS